MMNKVCLIGRLTKEPELRKTTSGTSVCQFTLAVNRDFKSEGQPDADFINCVAWKQKADVVCNYMHKGSQLGVDGRIQTRSYDDQYGKKVYVTEILVESVHFLDAKENSQPKQQATTQYTQQPTTQYTQDLNIKMDDLPF